MRKPLLVLALGLALIGCKPQASAPDTEAKAFEFVCYTDGKLTERHVGVKSVYYEYKTISVTIVYTDGVVSRYYPVQGESCQLEGVRNA